MRNHRGEELGKIGGNWTRKPEAKKSKEGGGTAEVEIQGTRGKKNRGLQERKTGDCRGEGEKTQDGDGEKNREGRKKENRGEGHKKNQGTEGNQTEHKTKQRKNTERREKSRSNTARGIGFRHCFCPCRKPRINNQFTAGRPLHHLLGFKSH